jgi:glutamine synthetase
VGHSVDAKRLTRILFDALRAFQACEVLREGLGEEFARAYVKLRTAEWNSYMGHLSEWERVNTLDV